MIYHTEHFVNSWKQGIWDDFLDLHTLTVSAGNDTKKFSLDATAMFVYLFIHLYHNLLEGKASEEDLLSWKSFIVDNQNKIIKPIVYAILDKLGLVRECRALVAVLIYNFNYSLYR